MKKLVYALTIMLSVLFLNYNNSVYANEVPATKKVCNAKGKCKVIKVHKKHLGKVIPVKKK